MYFPRLTGTEGSGGGVTVPPGRRWEAAAESSAISSSLLSFPTLSFSQTQFFPLRLAPAREAPEPLGLGSGHGEPLNEQL